MATTTGESDVAAPPASDGEALQSLFAKQCEGLMSESELRSIPAIKDMMEQGELLSSELSEIWKAAPKFPSEVEGEAEKIDVDSFIQVYRDIDDLFEEDGDDEKAKVEAVAEEAVDEEEAVADDDEVDEELKTIFATLTDGTISFSVLRRWSEVVALIEEEKLLGEDELVTMWGDSLGVKGKEGEMDLTGFVKFNSALDDMFEFDDDEEDAVAVADGVTDEAAEETKEEEEPVAAAPLPIITESDLPPGVLFSQLANENYLVGKAELSRWGDLNEMLKEEDLTSAELDTLFANAPKAPGANELDEDGFCALFDSIDSLFEDIDDDEAKEAKTDEKELKEELLELISDLAKLAEEEGQLLCGLDCGDLEQERVLEIVSEIERESYNQVVSVGSTGAGAVDKMELVGDWDLLYSSSSTMKYNEGLSGLAGGLTRFGGLTQKFTATKFLSDVEYTEQVIGKLGGNSFEVKISADWDLRTEVSLFTGKPSNVLSVTPDKVYYANRQDKADHWKSLGPLNLLLLTYLDEDLRIMRGNTSTDTLFIWRRSK